MKIFYILKYVELKNEPGLTTPPHSLHFGICEAKICSETKMERILYDVGLIEALFYLDKKMFQTFHPRFRETFVTINTM